MLQRCIALKGVGRKISREEGQRKKERKLAKRPKNSTLNLFRRGVCVCVGGGGGGKEKKKQKKKFLKPFSSNSGAGARLHPLPTPMIVYCTGHKICFALPLYRAYNGRLDFFLINLYKKIKYFI